MSLNRFLAIGITLSVIILGSCERPNQPPSTPLVVATDTLVTSGSQVGLSATATDPDGDVLFWEWHSTAGSFADSSNASTVWTAPTVSDTQLCHLMVKASDGRGGESSAQTDITVIPSGSGSFTVIIGGKVETDWVPFDGSAFDFYRFQALYQAHEINHEGTIVKLSLMPVTGEAGIFNNFRMYMLEVSRDSLESGFSANYEGQPPRSVFYSPSLSYGGAPDQWFDFVLSSPFAYDNTRNLLIEFTWKVDNGKSVKSYAYSAPSSARSNASQYEDASDGLLSSRLLYLMLTFEH